MPNLCSNNLSLEGPASDIAAFVSAVHGQESIANALLPIPSDQADNWYEWSIANYGTKWGDYETELVFHNDTAASYRFASAWGPMDEGIRQISTQFPTITFTLVYDEPGCEAMGGYLFSDGKVVNEVHVDPEEWPELKQDANGEPLFDEWFQKLDDLRDQVWSDIG